MFSQIGKYEIRSEIGRGGFGRVYLAFDELMSRKVAIKVLTSEADPELLKRFHAEARTTGKLRHKNIVTVYEFGDNDGVPFLAMELLEGQTLDNAIRDDSEMPLIARLRVIAEAAEGLRYAHEQGVIHRDVKPANIMLLPNGGVKIMDFGIARLIDLGSTRRIKNGDLTGTALYMAPEQFQGSGADVQTDIFSFGLVCYELFSSVHPFPEEDESGVVYRMATRQAKPLSQSVAGFPEPLSRVVERAMARDRDVRYQSVDDFILDIEPILVDLRCQKAAEMMQEVDRVAGSGDRENARSLLKRVLELDPSNAAARQLRNKFQSDDLTRAKRLRSDALLQEGSARLAALQYGEAIESFETILRVDPDCQEARLGFEKAHLLLGTSRARGRLLSQGKQEAITGNFSAALEHAVEALKMDPDNVEAQTFEREMSLRTALSKAADFVSLQEFEAADQVLNGLNAVLMAHPEAQAERERIQSERERVTREVRKKEFESWLAKIEQERVSGEFETALADAEQARMEFRDDFSDLSELILQIREEKAAALRTKIVQEACLGAQSLLNEGHFEAAGARIATALAVYPREKNLLRLRETAVHALAERQRDEATQQAISEVETLMKGDDLTAALGAVESAMERFPAVLKFTELAENIRATMEQRSAAAEWLALRTRAADAADSDAEAALAALEAGRARHGGSSDFNEVFETARLRSNLVLKLAAVHSAIEGKDWRSAGAKLEGVAQLGLDAATYDALASVIAAGRRVEKFSGLLHRAEQELDSGNTGAAAQLLSRVKDCAEVQAKRDELAARMAMPDGPDKGVAIAAGEKICKACAAALPAHARFCDSCGTPAGGRSL